MQDTTQQSEAPPADNGFMETPSAPLECSICHATKGTSKGTPFTPKGLAQHMRKMHSSKGALTCEICGKTRARNGKFWTKTGLRVHKARVHAQGKTPKAKTSPRQEASLPVKFCPHCGLNLQLLQAALTVGRSLA